MANLKRFNQEHIQNLIDYYKDFDKHELIMRILVETSYDDLLDILHNNGHITGRYGETI